jgi:hypothetical protein
VQRKISGSIDITCEVHRDQSIKNDQAVECFGYFDLKDGVRLSNNVSSIDRTTVIDVNDWENSKLNNSWIDIHAAAHNFRFLEQDNKEAESIETKYKIDRSI